MNRFALFFYFLVWAEYFDLTFSLVGPILISKVCFMS